MDRVDKVEIKEIFEAHGRSTWHVLCDENLGYYIPSYQREYSWGKANIERLFEDTTHGMRLLLGSSDSITFIGTIIAIHDTKYQTIEPIVKPDMPGKVMLIIDGQQRMVTLCLLFTVLHDLIRLESNRFSKDEEDEYRWLFYKSKEILTSLEKTFQFFMVHGDKKGEFSYDWYPRIIRSLDDTWSRQAKHAKYNSPISNYLFSYLNYIKKEVNKPYKHEIPEGKPSFVSKHEVVWDNCKLIKRKINEISRGKKTDLEMPKLTDMVNSKIFQETIFNDTIPEEVKVVLLSKEEDSKTENYKKLFRKTVLAKFIMERMALTVVSAKNEDYAFDMFEALNTTGEPLTAFETFKPKVIQAEGLSGYETSDTRKFMEVIEEYLDVYKKAQDKQKATSVLLIPFALSETGTKLSKRLSDQRRYLKDNYDNLSAIDEKRAFVQNLSHLASFVHSSWPDRSDDEPKLFALDPPKIDLELMCLDALRASGHSITIAPLVRFYSAYLLAHPTERDSALTELLGAIRAVMAFSCLWRGSRRSTDQIDSHYRTLMEDGFEDIGVHPFCRNPSSGGKIKPTLDGLLKALRHILFNKGKISNKEDWVKKASKQPIYDINVPICRFMLLAATHDTCPDPKEPGLVTTEAKSGVLDLLNMAQWRRDEKLTIEHVAPQNDTGNNWDPKIYEDIETVHSLGNLALLPAIENTVAGNNSWEQKKVIYSVLSSESLEECKTHLATAKTEGIAFKVKTEAILEDAKYLPHVRAISAVENGWDLDLIHERSRRLSEIIWNRLAPWIGL